MKKVLVAGLAVALLSGATVSIDLTGNSLEAVAMDHRDLKASEQKGNSAQSQKALIPYRQGDNAIIIIDGLVARIAGNMVTVNDKNGTSSTFEVNNARDFRVGDKVNVKNGAVEKVNGPTGNSGMGAPFWNKSKGVEATSGAATAK